MSLWEYLGNTQKLLSGSGGNNDTPNVKNNRLPFGVSMDVAKTLPNNPGGWNDALETARVETLSAAGRTISESLASSV